ncbi:MAG: hypothetical protein TR69_WS6001000776 [candidate division WS6 bacterium OLB20]|uniref:LiaF transmembrane domain-containing protein n=1 Tax=candidate division WS6 bacterium OLB20 TaxID=1617426 RepID=A0A136LYT5_9BACT|nr:MAG: hypothetical protein TR69_WS6001000776 [candidate division WS6 bacterium OLB20]
MQNLTSRLIWGGLFIFLGVVFLADNLLPGEVWGSVIRWWPVFLIAFGLWIALVHRRSLVAGVLFMFFGAALLAGNLGLFTFSLWTLWPLFLVAIGLSILLRQGSSKDKASADALSEVVVFGGAKRHVDSDSFKQGSLTAVFGSIELDFRDTQFADDAELEVVAVFGGVEL